MPIQVTLEDYNSQNFLQANAGDWVDGIVDILLRFSKGSGNSNTFTYSNQGGAYTLTAQSGDWNEDHGFAPGDSITLTYTVYGVPLPFQIQTFNTTVTYISGTVLHMADEFLFNAPGGAFPHLNGRVFPTDNLFSGILVVANKRPESMEFLFNLTPNGSSLLNSVLDTELNRFEVTDLDLVDPADPPVPMVQLINKSGGLLEDVEIEFLTEDLTTTWKTYRITYKIWQWGVIKDGFIVDNPPYYDQADCLAPVARLKAFAQYGNPNGVQIVTTANTQSNTGGFDENYNGGVNPYQTLNIDWVDLNLVPIDALDYSNKCTFTAIVSAPNQNNPNSTYRLGLVWRPINGTFYQNIANTNVGENLLLLAPEVDFIADGVNNPGPYLGYEDASGARWDFENVKFEITGVDEVTITGDVVPNAAAKTLFDGVPDGGRRSTLWCSIGNFNNDGTFLAERVSLKLFDEDNIDAPTIGIQHPFVVEENLLDHSFQDVSAPVPQTTTEDDVKYTSLFRFQEGREYLGVRVALSIFNSATGERFTLEQFFIDFENVPFVNGIHEVNEIINRGFSLPPSTDRNTLSLYREATSDIAGFYALRLDYGYLSNWKYWEPNPVVDFDFFDSNEPNNGLNNNWQRFYLPPDWSPEVSFYPRYQDGAQEVDDFNHFPVGIRPYEDEDADTVWTITDLATGNTPAAFIQDNLHEVEAEITWNAGDYDAASAWAMITLENFEDGSRWTISSVLAQGGVVANPLQAPAGVQGLELTFPATNVALLKCLVDTNNVNVDKISLSARIGSPGYPWLTTIGGKQARNMIHSFATKWTPPSVWNGAIIRVRRSSDNTQKDIPAILSGGFYVLDEAFLLAHVGNQVGDHGYVTVRYDQGGADFHEKFINNDQQPPIVIDGVILRDPDTNRPSALYNGTTHVGQIPGYLQTSIEAVAISVFNRVSNEDENIGYGFNSFGNPVTLRWRANGVVESGFGSVLNNHGSDSISTGSQLVMTYREITNLSPIEYTQFARKNGLNFASFVDNTTVASPYDRIGKTAGWYHKGYKTDDMYLVTTNNTPVELETIVNDQAGAF